MLHLEIAKVFYNLTLITSSSSPQPIVVLKADAPREKNKSVERCIFNIGFAASNFKLKKFFLFSSLALVERSTLFFGAFHYVVYSRPQSIPATDGRGRSQAVFLSSRPVFSYLYRYLILCTTTSFFNTLFM